MEEVKQTEGIYRKAAVMLRGLRTANIFQDGNKRTAYIVTKTFLEMNGEAWRIPPEKTHRFIIDLLHFTIDEIEEGLKHGEVKERSHENRRKDPAERPKGTGET